MGDLTAVAATIQAAQIQANYTLWSSIIGALGIGFAAWFAWQSGMKLHQHNNILEAKRQVYLDVVASGSLFFSFLKRFPRINEEFYNDYVKYNDDLLSKLSAILVVCNEENKEKTNSIINRHIEISNLIDSSLYKYVSLMKKTNKDQVVIEQKNEFYNELLNNQDIMTKEYNRKIKIYNECLFEFKSHLERNEMKAGNDQFHDSLISLKEKSQTLSINLNMLSKIKDAEIAIMTGISKLITEIIGEKLKQLEDDFEVLTGFLKSELI